MNKTLLAAVASATIISAPAAMAWSLSDHYSSFYVFGDSLTDPTDSATDGEVWAKPLTDSFGDPSRAQNFAIGGAQALGNGPTGTHPIHLDDQFASFDSVKGGLTFGASDLAAIWFGGNDVFFAGGYAQSLVEAAVPMDADSALGQALPIVQAAAAKVVGAIETLAIGYGIEKVVSFDLPDQGFTPAAAGFGAFGSYFLTELSLAFNGALSAGLDALEASFATNGVETEIVRVPISGLFYSALEDPSRYGLASMQAPCHVDYAAIVDPTVCTTPGLEGTPSSLLGFFDPVHPNSVLHAAIGNEVLEAIAPVPLPAGAPLLLAGLGLIALRRKR